MAGNELIECSTQIYESSDKIINNVLKVREERETNTDMLGIWVFLNVVTANLFSPKFFVAKLLF